MVPRSVLSSAMMVGVLLLGSAAGAQPQAAPSGGQAAPQPPASDPAGGGSGPATNAPEKKAPSVPAAGYAYGDRATASRRATHSRYRRHGPVVNTPGFEQTADGGSRLFVQLSQMVPVEERKAAGSITYVLKGASPRVWNNTNALVTVHFDTPVSRARLVPQGQDLLFVVELRAAATPTWKITESTDKSAILTIDFPKSDVLQAETAREAPAGETAPPPAVDKPARGKGRKPAPAKKPAAPKR